jgi:starch phosphorylase
MEIGVASEIPTYSGGLGVLAGDTLRAAADLQLPLVAVTLLYREGHFRQRLDSAGNQFESADDWSPESLLEPVAPLVSVEVEGRSVRLRAWRFTVHGVKGGEVPVFMLDADLPENDARDRALTGRLYVGDQAYRLRQEAVLGLGGIAMLRALGYHEIETYHLNEGHSALLTVALLQETTPGGSLERAREAEFAAVRRRCVFTTHTPVPAGHDRFSGELVRSILGEPLGSALLRLPCCSRHEVNMTHLGMYFSRYINAVAARHREVAQLMNLDYNVRSITNGVHSATWASPSMAALFDEHIPGWREDNHYLRQASLLPLDRLRAAHATAKQALLDAVRRRTGVGLSPEVMTVGFARRATTYKRADFLFGDLDELRQIVHESGPLQLVYAGKAHPQDEAGKEMIRRIFTARDSLAGDLAVVYLEDYDIDLGRILTAGADLWLNNPEKPMEASGTSGMKAALNGVPSLSVLDGWWPEGWIEGVTGWSIGDGSPAPDPEEESRSLYTKLGEVVLPLFYGSPLDYAAIMRNAIAVNGSYFTAQRMVEQYHRNAYDPNRVRP